MVHNGIATYLLDISPDICHDIHQYYSYRYNQHLFTGLKVNDTRSRPATIAGEVHSDGWCQGASFSDSYGSWTNVIVEGTFEFKIEEYYAPINIDEDKIILRNGRHCKLSSNACLDTDGSAVFWTLTPPNQCSFSNFDVLYEGPAKRIYDNTTQDQDIEEVYSVENGDVTFGLSRKGSEYICDYQIIRTEHPKIYILEIKRENIKDTRTPIVVNNLDLMTYVNTKFVHIEKHFGKQLKNLYLDVLTQKCRLERQVLENSLLIAHTKPAEFALKVMKTPGYMAYIAGEVIHIIKCTPVLATIARLPSCYNHLPVIVNNETMFATPHTHILLKRSPKANCNSLLAPIFKIDDSWIKINPEPLRVLGPEELEPLTKASWKYESLASLATSGIYSRQDMEKLQDHLMFSEEQNAILDSIARGSIGENVEISQFSFAHLIDEKSIDKIAQRTTAKLWGWLTGFGTISAGMIGLFIVLKIIKFMVDTLIHGYALHRVFGWSLWLLGACWDSVSNFLLHFKRPEKEIKTTDGSSTQCTEKTEKSPPTESIPLHPPTSNAYPDLSLEKSIHYNYPRV